MSNNLESGMAPQMLPVCPHCGADPVEIIGAPVRLGDLSLLSLLCGNPNCRRLLAIQLMGVVQKHTRIIHPS